MKVLSIIYLCLGSERLRHLSQCYPNIKFQEMTTTLIVKPPNVSSYRDEISAKKQNKRESLEKLHRGSIELVVKRNLKQTAC